MTVALLALALGCKEKAAGGTDDSDTVVDSDLVGKTWAIDGRKADWIDPPTDKAPPFEPILLAVARDHGDTIDLRMAVGGWSSDGVPVQVGDRVTASLAGASLGDDGHFVFGPEDITVTGTESALAIQDLVLEGTFTKDRSRIDGVRATGRLDFSLSYTILGRHSPEDACDFVSGWGAQCVSCEGPGMYCVPFEVQVPEALRIDGLTLAEVASGSLCSSVLVLPFGAIFFRRRKATA